MNGRDPPSDSFDPRSWGAGVAPAGGPATPAKPESEASSFDPSTWASKPAEAAPAAAPEKVSPAIAPPSPVRRRQALAAASGIAILLAGAGAAYLTRNPTPQAPAREAGAPVKPSAGQSTRTVTVGGPDMILAALVDMGIDAATARQVAQQALTNVGPAPGEIRLTAQLSSGDSGSEQLVGFEATRSDGSGVSLSRAADGNWAAQKLDSRLERRILSARGEMDINSFYTSAVTAGISDAVISDFAKAFSFEVDFQRDIKPGDIFEAAFEQAYNPAGEPVGTPRLLFASLRLATKSLRLYKFKPPGEAEDGWFDANGRSNVRSLMRTPLDGARVSSNFGYRLHPVHGVRKLHRGTDFAAPVGTSVYASASGEVIGAGPDRCAGNLIKIQHDNGWQTKYFHLSRFAPGITPGSRVQQGVVIGEVGNTGTCTTGPHLHYEVWVENEPVDALSIDTGTGVTLEGAALAGFMRERDRIDQARSEQQ